MPNTIQDTEAWRPTNAPLTNDAANRSAGTYVEVIRQFDVASNPRYTPGRQGHNETYCNIFLWDVTRALACEIPHWVAPDGAPGAPGGDRKELNANATCDWLEVHGAAAGWRLVDAAAAVAEAQQGRPAIAVWKNPGGIGHVGVLLPTSDAATVRIAQAGRTNFYDEPVTHGFGNRPLTYYAHL